MLLLKCLWGLCLGLCSYASPQDSRHHTEKTPNPRQAESRLKHRLLKDYDPEVRPLLNFSHPIDVHVTFNPIRIDDLDLRSEVFRITGWGGLTWTDQFLQWDPEKEDNITCLLFHREDIWIPPLSIFNSMRGMLMSHDKTHYSQAQVCWDGLVRYVTMEHFVLSCDVDINFFPFDRQKCDIKVLSWYHHSRELHLLVKEPAINCSLYEEDGEWILQNTDITITTVPAITGHANSHDETFPLLVFSLTMLRRPTYYVVNVLLPCLMLCVLVLINFFLPPDSGEKVSLGITVLLAFTVFQLLIADIVPTSAVRTPKLAIFLLCIMATSTSSIIISVLVLDLHHRAICTQPPLWLRRLVLDLLARVVCMRDSHMMRHVVQPFLPESRECHTPSAAEVVYDNNITKPSVSMVDTKFRLTVEEAAVGEGGMGSPCNIPLKMAASDFTLQKRKKMEADRSPLSVHRPHELGGSEHRMTGRAGLTTARNAQRMGSSERELTCQSLIFNPESAHTLFPLQTKSTQRLIHSINTLTNQAAAAGGAAGGAAYYDQKCQHSQQEFVLAVRDVYNELRNSRHISQREQALENEWKMIARVMDRLFFWITFFVLFVTAFIIFPTFL